MQTITNDNQSANDWDDSLRYTLKIGKHYMISTHGLHVVKNSYVITEENDQYTTIFITGE